MAELVPMRARTCKSEIDVKRLASFVQFSANTALTQQKDDAPRPLIYETCFFFSEACLLDPWATEAEFYKILFFKAFRTKEIWLDAEQNTVAHSIDRPNSRETMSCSLGADEQLSK